MTLAIYPASTIEAEPYHRLIDGIPAGEFYLRAEYVQPRLNGENLVNFKIEGQRGDPDATGSRLMVDVYVNGERARRVAMTANVVTLPLRLEGPPTLNYVRAVEGTFDGSSFVPTGSSAGTSVAVTNYGSVFYGAGLDYYRHVWLPYQTQEYSLTSYWSSRLVEWYFKFHRRFPDTQAMRTLATRLASRATWTELPTNRGMQDMIGALCASEPLFTEVTNTRSTWDLALNPLYPVSANWGGWDIDVWLPDIPTAREQALLRLARNLDFLELEDYSEGHTFLGLQGQDVHLDILKDRSATNLSYLLRQIGTMDSWKSWLQVDVEADYFLAFWDNAFDSLVVAPGLGGGDPFDTFDGGGASSSFFPNPSHSETFDSGALDSGEAFTEMWTGLTVNVFDGGTIALDSSLQVARCDGEMAPHGPEAWEWEWTGGIEAAVSTASTVTNTLHGGAAPDYSV